MQPLLIVIDSIKDSTIVIYSIKDPTLIIYSLMDPTHVINSLMGQTIIIHILTGATFVIESLQWDQWNQPLLSRHIQQSFQQWSNYRYRLSQVSMINWSSLFTSSIQASRQWDLLKQSAGSSGEPSSARHLSTVVLSAQSIRKCRAALLIAILTWNQKCHTSFCF